MHYIYIYYIVSMQIDDRYIDGQTDRTYFTHTNL